MPLAERALQVVVIALYSGFVVASYAEILIGWGAIVGWVYAHETLSTGLLAIISAIIGAWFLHRQTTELARQEANRLARHREAARVVMPLALSSISQYAYDSARATKHLLDQCEGELLPSIHRLDLPTIPDPPAEAINSLRQLVESVDVQEVKPVAMLIADIQVQHARLRGVVMDSGVTGLLTLRGNLEEHLIDCALISARTDRLFRFGRGGAVSIQDDVTWRDVYNSVSFFGIYEETHKRIFESLDSFCDGNKDSIVENRWSAYGH